jgi:hypothetical protein
MTMKLIETKTLGAAAASIEFTSIPQTFTDLVVFLSLRSDGASGGTQTRILINTESTNFSSRNLNGTGSAVGSSTSTVGIAGSYAGSGDTANTFSNQTVYITNYTAAVAKSMSIDSVYENNATTAYQVILAQLWNNAAAITGLTFSAASPANLVAGSTISLYGVLKGTDGIVTTS